MENLLKFPQATFVDKLIPKAKFAKASNTPTAVRDLLATEFEQIRLLYAFRSDTLNVEPGSEVSEIDVFFFRCKGDQYTPDGLSRLDMLLPRHTMFVIQRQCCETPSDGNFCYDIIMQHKRRTIVAGVPKWKCEASQFQKDIDLDNNALRIEGMNLDRIYFNLLSQLSGYRVDNSEELMAIKALEDEIARKRRQAEALQKKVRMEKQFNLQIELNAQARAVKKEITELTQRLNEYKRQNL